MLTLEQFIAIPPETVFAKGELPDSPNGLHMTGSGKMMKWVAVKGWANDWSVYCHWSENSFDFVKESGDKVMGKENILHAVPCIAEVLDLYRY